jgi:hypothetical protein
VIGQNAGTTLDQNVKFILWDRKRGNSQMRKREHPGEDSQYEWEEVSDQYRERLTLGRSC